MCGIGGIVRADAAAPVDELCLRGDLVAVECLHARGMALVGILSTQIWYESFCGPGRVRYAAEKAQPRVYINTVVESTVKGV